MIKKFFCAASVVILLVLSGCTGSDSVQMANEIKFDIDNVSDVTISYDEEAVAVFQSDSDELIIKEYMSSDKSQFYADVKQTDKSIHISEGGKPLFKSDFTRHIEVYLPENFEESLTLITTDGNIEIADMALKLDTLIIETTTGSINLDRADTSNVELSTTKGKLSLGSITADKIELSTTSGKIDCKKLCGAVSYTSTSGDINVESAVGSGNYRTNNSGKLKVLYSEVTDNLTLYNKNDDVELTLPKDLEFKFKATAKNGSVNTSFQKDVNTKGDSSTATIGNNPSITIKTESKNGNIKVTK